MRLYVQSVEESKPHAISPEGVGTTFVLAAGDDLVADVGPDRQVYTIDQWRRAATSLGRARRRGAHSLVGGWTQFVRLSLRRDPARVVQVDVASGQRRPWKDLDPADSAGIDTISGIMMAADAKAYVYGYVRTLCDLYLVEGLK